MTKPYSLIPFVFGDWDKDFFNRALSSKLDLPVEASEWSPRIDIKEEDNQFIVKADVPGVDPKNIHISIDKNTIQISGEKETQHKEETKDYVHVERFKGSFSRTISLPNFIDSENIQAKSKNGVLEIIIPKTNKNVSRRIEVKEDT